MNIDNKFEELSKYYKIESPEEIKSQIEKNENIFVFLEEVKPFLEKSFSDGEFCLDMNFEPEVDDDFIILFIEVSRERFNNGIGDEIRLFNLETKSLRRKFNIFRELLVMPGIKDV